MKKHSAYLMATEGTRLGQRLGLFAPATLMVRGNLDTFAPMVAIVGTRHPDAYGTEMTRLISGELASVGITVVSGGALGIDGLAHNAAISVKGKTVAVLGGGLANPHPLQHVDMFEQIATRHGAVVSEYPVFKPTQRFQFLERNRLIAAMSDAVVVIQAGARSGALNTAKWARELGVPIFTVPADAWYAKSLGSLSLLQRGAIPLTSPRDLATVPGLSDALKCRRWPMPGNRPQGFVPPWKSDFGTFNSVNSDILEILAMVRERPLFIEEISEEISEKTGFKPGHVQALVLELEMDDLIERLPDGRISATRTYLPNTID